MAATPDWQALCAAAHAAERSAARRLVRRTGISDIEALSQTLAAAAFPDTLAGLLGKRHATRCADLARRDARQQSRIDGWNARKLARQPDPNAWLGWFDGSAWPNPGRIGLGALLCSPHNVVTEISTGGGHGDSNQAEYLALIALLEAAVPLQPAMLVLHGDSRIVIDDMTGVHLVAAMQELRTRAQTLIAQLGTVHFRWIPRARNGVADALSQRARQA